jgi:ABC-2 type transport system ATP-binding protein
MQSLNPPLVSATNLEKRFGSVHAVRNVSFSIQRGESVALLGPNGAGKTTTISILAGLLTPDSGSVSIDGTNFTGDDSPAKQALGLVPQELALYDNLSAFENLRLFGSLYNLSGSEIADKAKFLLDLVGLSDRLRDRVKTFSGGMKRRLNIAVALLHDPTLLLLDEPTVGVDPQSRNAIFENIEKLRASGKTIIYTTHYMEEAERLCDRVILVDHGKVVADESMAGLKTRYTSTQRLHLQVIDLKNPNLADEIRSLPGVKAASLKDSVLSVEIDDLNGGGSAVLNELSRRKERCLHLTSERPNLESVFLELTGHNLRDK